MVMAFRIYLSIFKIILGTVEMNDADTEFVLRSYIRSRAPLMKAKDEESDGQ